MIGQPRHQVPFLDGLRGIAAFVVVMTHLAGAFYPAILFDQPGQAHTRIEHLIATTPLNLLFSGDLAVQIFFVISGFVLTYKYFRHYERSSIIQAMLKRYIRLVIPVAASVLLTYMLMRLKLFSNVDVAPITHSTAWFGAFWLFAPRIDDAFKNAFIGVPFYADNSYNPVTWTMHYEFIGSLLVFATVLLIGRFRWRFIIYALLVVALFNTNYVSFLGGLMIADLAARRPEYTVSPWVWAPALIIGVCIGAFPTYHHHTANTVYAALDQLPQYLPAILGALLIFLAVMTSAPLQRGLSSRPLLLLGKISFSMYLVHLIILGTFSAALFAFTARALPYHLAFLGMLLPTLAVIAGVSWAFYRVVDQPAIQWSQAFAQAITSRSAQLQPQPQERRETP